MVLTRNCKLCGCTIPRTKDYCPLCRVQLEQGGKPPIYVCEKCGLAYGEKKHGGKSEENAWKDGECAICGERVPVAHYRLFGYLTRGALNKALDVDKVYEKLTLKQHDASKV